MICDQVTYIKNDTKQPVIQITYLLTEYSVISILRGFPQIPKVLCHSFSYLPHKLHCLCWINL